MHPERRQHVRILTIRNFGGALLVLLIALATANLISELRAPHRGEYGRLTLRAEPVTLKQPEVVTEGEVPDETPAGPATALLSESASVAPAPSPAHQPAMLSVKTVGDHVTIVGGRDGIHVETTQRNATPKLSGGIFRIEN